MSEQDQDLRYRYARMPPPDLTDADITAEQLSWAAQDAWSDLYLQWPVAHRCEFIDGELHFDAGNDESEPWDWRSVVLAMRTYPGAQVRLWSPGLLIVRLVGQGASTPD